MSYEIGVVVPTYNCGPTLDSTLLSLRRQGGVDIEIIVVDSGSTDDTLGICERWKVKVVYDPPGNMYRAINKGMGLLQAKWITYLNGDDYVFLDSYKRLMSLGEAENADVVYGNCDYIDRGGRFRYSVRAVPVRLLKRLSLQSGVMGFAQSAAVFRAVAYEELSKFDEGYRFVADFAFFSKAIAAGKRFSRLSGPAVCAFRIHDEQLSARHREPMGKEVAEVMGIASWKRRAWGTIALIGWRLLNLDHYLMRLARVKRVGTL